MDLPFRRDDITLEPSDSNASSCSWDVISEEGSQDGSHNKVCSVCGLEITHIYFNRPSCDVCVLCESCQGLNLSEFPRCSHVSWTPRHDPESDDEMANGSSANEFMPTVHSLPTASSELMRPSDDDVQAPMDETDSCTERKITEPRISGPNSSDQSLTALSDRVICTGDSTRSLTEHIIEALQHSSPPISIPGSFSTMMPSARAATSQRLRYSPPVMNFARTGGSSFSRSNSPSPVSFTGPLGGSESNRKCTSPPPSPELAPMSTSPPTTDNAGKSGAMQFLKSVVLHSTAALNNFDLLPLDCPGTDPVIKPNSPVTHSPTPPVQTAKWLPPPPDPISSFVKVWDDEKLSMLIKPKSIPKAVPQTTAYNLR